MREGVCIVSEAWRDDAACTEVDPDLFFPDQGGSTQQVKRLCGGCPVAAECLAFALEERIQFGIWGGLSTEERKRILRGAA